MKKNYYAIKIGNGVENIIVTTWEECKHYTHYYNSIYKGFTTQKQANKWLNSFTDEDIHNRLEFQLKMKYLRDKEIWLD